jgi:hypothetical protein
MLFYSRLEQAYQNTVGHVICGCKRLGSVFDEESKQLHRTLEWEENVLSFW